MITVPVTVVVPGKTLVVPATTVISSVAVPCPTDAEHTLVLNRLTALEAAVADLKSSIIVIPPVVPPPYDPQIQWRTGMESGDLSGWSEKVNTGFADSTAVQVALEGLAPRTGKLYSLPSLWVMKQAITAPSGVAEASGTRMVRYPEINTLCKAGVPFYYSWWDFFPTTLAVASGGWYVNWEIMSNDSTGKPSPLWVMGIDTNMAFNLTGGPVSVAPKTFIAPFPVPVAQWNFFEVYIVPRSDATGALKVWLNGVLALDIPNVQTQFPFTTQSLLTWMQNTCYGVGFPTPFAHYVDDVSVSLGRLP